MDLLDIGIDPGSAGLVEPDGPCRIPDAAILVLRQVIVPEANHPGDQFYAVRPAGINERADVDVSLHGVHFLRERDLGRITQIAVVAFQVHHYRIDVAGVGSGENLFQIAPLARLVGVNVNPADDAIGIAG
jgi:hypothetical protein